jgi:hypothetical protein
MEEKDSWKSISGGGNKEHKDLRQDRTSGKRDAAGDVSAVVREHGSCTSHMK